MSVDDVTEPRRRANWYDMILKMVSKKQNLLVKDKFSEIMMVNRYNELYRMIINK